MVEQQYSPSGHLVMEIGVLFKSTHFWLKHSPLLTGQFLGWSVKFPVNINKATNKIKRTTIIARIHFIYARMALK
jgi:hypothetical protein